MTEHEKEYMREYMRDYRKSHREQINARRREWNRAHPDIVRERNKRSVQRRIDRAIAAALEKQKAGE